MIRFSLWQSRSIASRSSVAALVAGVLVTLGVPTGNAQMPSSSSALDTRVKAFLDKHRGTWQDLNVPDADGETLYKLILEHGYKRALEIGTSTGHSGIWMAWALSKTGGKLTTIEIDPERHKTALANFKEAGVADYIDARLADAHDLVPALEGPFDFVFSDADKDWYKNYLIAVWPKVSIGGCFAAHNVTSRQEGITQFLEHLNTLPDARTTIDRKTSAGLSISYKIARR